MVLFHHEMAIFKVLNNYTNGRALFVLQPDGKQDTAPYERYGFFGAELCDRILFEIGIKIPQLHPCPLILALG